MSNKALCCEKLLGTCCINVIFIITNNSSNFIGSEHMIPLFKLVKHMHVVKKFCETVVILH